MNRRQSIKAAIGGVLGVLVLPFVGKAKDAGFPVGPDTKVLTWRTATATYDESMLLTGGTYTLTENGVESRPINVEKTREVGCNEMRQAWIQFCLTGKKLP